MASDLAMYNAVESSNISPSEKSELRKFLERTTGISKLGRRAKGHLMETGHALRQGGESILVGGILGAVHAEAKTGLDVKGVPADAVVGVVGMLGGVAMANEGIGPEFRNAGATGLSIFTFRKTYDFLAEKKIAKGQQPGGQFGPTQKAKVAGELDEMRQSLSETTDEPSDADDADVGEDPIVAAAKEL
jgi:hypothetical protein